MRAPNLSFRPNAARAYAKCLFSLGLNCAKIRIGTGPLPCLRATSVQNPPTFATFLLVGRLPSTEYSQAGITKVWSLCDNWLKHIERGIFPGSYFFHVAF